MELDLGLKDISLFELGLFCDNNSNYFLTVSSITFTMSFVSNLVVCNDMFGDIMNISKLLAKIPWLPWDKERIWKDLYIEPNYTPFLQKDQPETQEPNLVGNHAKNMANNVQSALTLLD